MTGKNQVKRFDLVMPDIGCNDLSRPGPRNPVRVPKTIRINLTNCIGIGFAGKRIRWRNSILTIFTVVPGRVNPDNCSPNSFFVVSKKGVAKFNARPIANSNIQKSIVCIARFGQRIECYLLHSVV